jgi:pyruvate/2-oxoglutarate dehydrogenase complex dihydrolipoamide dehydrogenase (E3) component
MAEKFDAIIIGTGQSGPSMAYRLSKSGLRVAVIERGAFGGTCVNTGCIPTKTMVASAYAAHMAKRARDFGVKIDCGIAVDLEQVQARKAAVSGKSRASVESTMKGLENGAVYEGHGHFISPHEVRVGDATLTAEKIFINVGGRAIVPDMPGVHEVDYLTNSSMMHLSVLPEHLVVIGGSYVGLEFGQMFRRFGSQVTIVEMSPRLVHREDEDVSRCIKDIMEQEGISVRLNAKCIGFKRTAVGISVQADCKEAYPELIATHVLLAVGRRPNTDDLGLAEAGVETDKRGYIVVDDELRTSVPGVWALGDCNGKGAFTHTSYNDYEIVAGNLLDNDRRRLSDRIQCYALYVDPPLGRAGMTDAEVLASGKRALVAKREMTRVSRAVEKGETNGFMKVVVDKESKQILGAAILGTGGDEVIHSILDIMYARAPYTVIQRAMHIHPTVSELIPTMLADLKPLTASK